MEYDITFIKAIDEVEGVKSFRFERPKDFVYKAGQYIQADLSEKLLRFFSLSSSPSEEGFIQITTRMSGSDYKNSLNLLKAGDKINITGPLGEFTYKPEYKKIAFLSGGIGITPIRSIARYVTDEKVDVDMVLFYGNRNEAGILFRGELDAIAKAGNIRVVHVLSAPGPEWKGYTGYISRDVIEKEIPDYPERAFYICGPPAMVSAMKKTLDEMLIKDENIILENFLGY